MEGPVSFDGLDLNPSDRYRLAQGFVDADLELVDARVERDADGVATTVYRYRVEEEASSGLVPEGNQGRPQSVAAASGSGQGALNRTAASLPSATSPPDP